MSKAAFNRQAKDLAASLSVKVTDRLQVFDKPYLVIGIRPYYKDKMYTLEKDEPNPPKPFEITGIALAEALMRKQIEL